MTSISTELQAVVFDMDGVIIESEMTHYRAICEAMGENMKVPYEVFLEQCTGGDERFAMGRMATFSDMSYDEELFQEWSRRKATAYARLISEEVSPMPGAIQLVESVAEELPIGLATGSRRSDVDAALHVLGGGCLAGLFQTIVTSEDVADPKPHPGTYSKAVEDLGIEPSACFAIEDSPNGIASALGAGLRVIGVAVMHDASKLSRAERVVSTLTDVSLNGLRQWFAEPLA
ncbi:MAG: HAD family phosphatase [Opitutae bacterium]|nr:HAD family phosphatase [Opitutae bacterium]